MSEIKSPANLDETQQRIAIAAEKIAEAITDTSGVWGFMEDYSTLDTANRIVYTGDAADFSPVTVNSDGSVELGSWQEFYDKLNNHPWMVKADGTPDYRLQDNDYTKKLDGTASDVANTSYNGGAYAWLKRIYKKEVVTLSKRLVSFRFTKAEGYEPEGFIDPDNNILEGVWLPMFYASTIDGKARTLSGLQPDYNVNTSTQNSRLTAMGSRHKFLGGPLVNTLADIEIMLCKNADVQIGLGRGNCSGYNAAATPAGTNGVLANKVVNGGPFYCTQDGKTLNKFFHSIVLGSFQQWMRDPYTLLVSGEYKVSKNYAYDLTGDSYESTGIKFTATGGWWYPTIYSVIDGFGCLPTPEASYGGSTSTGGADGLYVNVSGVRVALRFGDCNDGLGAGPRCLYLADGAGGARWNIGSADLLLPPAGVAA